MDEADVGTEVPGDVTQIRCSLLPGPDIADEVAAVATDAEHDCFGIDESL